MLPLQHFCKGDSIRLRADFLETVRNMLEGLTVYFSNDNSASVQAPQQNGKGWAIFIPKVSHGYLKPFDITIDGADSFDISDALTGQAVWYRGKRITTIAAGSGLTFTTDHWSPTSGISGSQYVWLEMDNSNAGETTIVMGTDMQSDPEDPRYDYIEVFPLWYIPFASGAITEAGIGDLRGNFNLSAMA
jgi:hypothetical protein